MGVWGLTSDRQPRCLQGAIERLAAPREFFHSCYHRFLCLADSALQSPAAHEPEGARSVYIETDPDTDRALCARAMADVYSVHAAVIGTEQSGTCRRKAGSGGMACVCVGWGACRGKRA